MYWKLTYIILLSTFISSIFASSKTSEIKSKDESVMKMNSINSVYIAPDAIESGCARFYISDPRTNPGTATYQVCANSRASGSKSP